MHVFSRRQLPSFAQWAFRWRLLKLEANMTFWHKYTVLAFASEFSVYSATIKHLKYLCDVKLEKVIYF